MVQRIADVLHYEAHLFLRAFLTNNNRRMMVGIREKVRNFAADSPTQESWLCGGRGARQKQRYSLSKGHAAMDINTSELDHITDKLAGALMRPLQERIAQLEEENRNLQGMLDETNHALALQVLALQEAHKKIAEKTEELKRARSEQNQQTLMAVIYHQYIPLSKPATQEYVVNITDNHDRALLAHFFMHTLPKDAPKQLTEEVTKMTQLPTRPAPVAPVTHNHYEAGSSAQVFNGDVSASTFNPTQ